MGVSKNRSTPKSSILIRLSIINHPFWGTPLFRNIHMCLKICTHTQTLQQYFVAFDLSNPKKNLLKSWCVAWVGSRMQPSMAGNARSWDENSPHFPGGFSKKRLENELAPTKRVRNQLLCDTFGPILAHSPFWSSRSSWRIPRDLKPQITWTTYRCDKPQPSFKLNHHLSTKCIYKYFFQIHTHICIYIYIHMYTHFWNSKPFYSLTPPKIRAKRLSQQTAVGRCCRCNWHLRQFLSPVTIYKGWNSTVFFWVIFFSTHHQSSPLSQPSYGLCLNPWGLPSGHVRACGGRVDCVRRCRISCGGKWRSGTYGRWMVMVFPEILTTYIYI